MITEIHKNYSAFREMLLATTALSNRSSKKYDDDCKAIIDFIGEAYGLEKDLVEYCKKVILDELVTISTDQDIRAFVNSHTADSELEELDSLLSAKCDVIGVIRNFGEVRSPQLSEAWFDYSHSNPYYPEIRYQQLSIAASTGNVVANKIVGILSVLGIGCDATREMVLSGVYRLRQCAIWGDISSLILIRQVYRILEMKEQVKLYDELVSLVPFMKEGRTVIPQRIAEKISREAIETFAIICSIKQDIILNQHKFYIDYSFVEVMLLKEVDYYDKLHFINRYDAQEWKEVTNSSFNPNKKIGFKIGE